LIDRDDKRRYLDYAKDPLDLTLVNAQLEIQGDLIVLKCIRNIAAGNEILISFGLVFWAVYFIDFWNNSEELMKRIKLENVYLLMKKVKEVYSIKDDFITTIYDNYYICKTIANKLDEFDSWKNSHPLTHFIPNRGSTDMIAFYQCLSHIPALTRLILETEKIC